MNVPVDQQQVSESHSGEQIVWTVCNRDNGSHSLLSSCVNADFATKCRFMLRLILAFLTCAALSNSVYAQQSDPFAPAQPLADGWEQMDQRLIFLMVRLVDVEANLDAVDAAIAKSGGRAASARSAANRAEAGSDRMDRRAGGPVRWDQFYGRTAEKFFYHPTQNHTYHTQTILSQQSPSNDNQSGSGVPSRQGLPVHQRPPQFDYMYRANENAKERATAEVAKIANKVDALAARRAELELEQSKLWCEVAFRVVSRNDLDKKPLYRFMPKGTGQESLTAAASFVVVALSIVKSGESDQGGAFRQIKPLVSKARSELGDKWLQLGVNYQDQSSDEWKFATLARHLEDVSSNLSDSYAVSIDSARNSDNDRRDMYRGLLQKSLVQYAEAVLALNEMASEMATSGRYEPDLQKELHATNASFLPRTVEPSNPSGRSESNLENSICSIARVSEIDGYYLSVTKDGLTVFWEGIPGGSIHSAKRRSTDAYFTDHTMLFPGRHPAVSGDGLELVFLANSPSSQVASLHVATRGSIDDDFSRGAEITELRNVKTPKCPFLTSDGLLLCFIRNTDGVSDVAFCVRENRQSRWSLPKPLLVVPQHMRGIVTWPAVTADRLSCFSCIEGLDAGNDGRNLVIWRRSSLTEPFKDYSLVELPGLPPLKIRSPRFIESSRELFFSAHPKAVAVVGNGIVKNFPMP